MTGKQKVKTEDPIICYGCIHLDSELDGTGNVYIYCKGEYGRVRIGKNNQIKPINKCLQEVKKWNY